VYVTKQQAAANSQVVGKMQKIRFDLSADGGRNRQAHLRAI